MDEPLCTLLSKRSLSEKATILCDSKHKSSGKGKTIEGVKRSGVERRGMSRQGTEDFKGN